MTFRVVPELLDSIDMVYGVEKFLRVMNAVTLELRDAQGVIARRAIFMDYGFWLVSLSNDRDQRILSDIPNENNLKLASGAEWMFLPNRSAKVEYLCYDLREPTAPLVNTSLKANGTTGAEAFTNEKGPVSGNIIHAGVNYHFNGGAAPVVVKY